MTRSKNLHTGAGRSCCNDPGVAEQLKALGHPVRLQIMDQLAHKHCCCCAEVCSQLPFAQSTISQHLDVLKKSGLVQFEQNGTRSLYTLDPSMLRILSEQLLTLADMAERTMASRKGNTDRDGV